MKVTIKYSPQVEALLLKFNGILATYDKHLIDNAQFTGSLLVEDHWPATSRDRGFNPVISMLLSQDQGRRTILKAIDQVLALAQPIDIILTEEDD